MDQSVVTSSDPQETDFVPRDVCLRCRRPKSVCYCAALSRIETQTRVVLLQHPRERDMAIGTARMASLCLPNSRLLVGFDWQNSAELSLLLSDPNRPAVLLYPGEGATDVNDLAGKEPLTLVVVDGTWANTKKMVRQNPVLANLPRIAFYPARPSEYRIRREPNAMSVSTIEALMYVLGAIEGGVERYQSLLTPFRKMIDTQLRCRDQRGTPRSRHQRRVRSKQSLVPSLLLQNRDRIVCVGGEANAWPCRDLTSRAAYPDELVQWVAYRPSTREGFECFVAPKNPLSPSTPSHLELDAEQLRTGGNLAELFKRWCAFVRDDDIICSWGRYASVLFLESGGYLPTSRFDLRVVTKDVLKRNIGTMEAYYASLTSTPAAALARGRAGVRLGQLSYIADQLCTESVE
ncbi:MAG TPA: DTW domain-containing protein [Polyangiaceae bacterium]|nr:DTW domain-containing protein [Polyangiaceae bacterium]